MKPNLDGIQAHVLATTLSGGARWRGTNWATIVRACLTMYELRLEDHIAAMWRRSKM